MAALAAMLKTRRLATVDSDRRRRDDPPCRSDAYAQEKSKCLAEISYIHCFPSESWGPLVGRHEGRIDPAVAGMPAPMV
jgi:hypothetical protein